MGWPMGVSSPSTPRITYSAGPFRRASFLPTLRGSVEACTTSADASAIDTSLTPSRFSFSAYACTAFWRSAPAPGCSCVISMAVESSSV